MIRSVLIMVDPIARRPGLRAARGHPAGWHRVGRVPGARPLPSAKTLSQEHGIAIGTAMKAFDLLKAEGLIRTVPGRGMWVVPQDPDGE